MSNPVVSRYLKIKNVKKSMKFRPTIYGFTENRHSENVSAKKGIP